MEFELVEFPEHEDRGGDSRIIRNQRARADAINVDAEDYPHRRDQALLIPEEELC